MGLKENKMLKNKWITIPLGVIIYFIFMLNLPRFTGWMTIISVIALCVYLFTRNEKFKSYSKIVKSIITIVLGFLVLFGAGLTTMPTENIEKSRLAAEKVNIEKQKEDDEKQRTEQEEAEKQKIAQAEDAKKLEEEQKRVQEEQLKREQEEQAKKDAEEKVKAEEEARRKAEEEKRIKKEQESKKKENEVKKDESPNAESSSSSQLQVVISVQGKKYHLPGCRTVKQEKERVSVEEAKNQGYGACGVCKP